MILILTKVENDINISAKRSQLESRGAVAFGNPCTHSERAYCGSLCIQKRFGTNGQTQNLF